MDDGTVIVLITVLIRNVLSSKLDAVTDIIIICYD